MAIEVIALDRLEAHPGNSNVMAPDLFEKLVKHLERTGRYPPIVVRPREGAYQILDGHHRVEALRRLGHDAARCVVWEVDDAEAMLLLATLNRLQGTDDPRKRGHLLERLSQFERFSAADLAGLLPESRERLERLVALAREAPRPRPGRVAEDLPVPVHFFLLTGQKRQLEARLREIGGSRESALMCLVAGGERNEVDA